MDNTYSNCMALQAACASLKPKQLTALTAIIANRTFSEAAASAHVSRVTLYRWLHGGGRFQAAYDAWRNEIVASAQRELDAKLARDAANMTAACSAARSRFVDHLMKGCGTPAPS